MKRTKVCDSTGCQLVSQWVVCKALYGIVVSENRSPNLLYKETTLLVQDM